jgi:hypothetical protein
MTPTKSSFLQRLKYSNLSRVAALPLRVRVSVGPLLRQAGLVLRWLASSREWANFSVEYEPEGLQAVLCVLAHLTGKSLPALRALASELQADSVFATRYQERVAKTRLRYTCDPQLQYGRCLVHYVLVRATGVRVIFEAGTDRGLSTWAMCRALQRNLLDSGEGAKPLLITVDIAPDRGEMLDGDEGGLVRRLVGDSVAALVNTPERIELFLHDTTNEMEHTRAQLQALGPRLARRAWVHSCWFSLELLAFCEAEDLQCLEYAERPRHHWYSGGRCALAARQDY